MKNNEIDTSNALEAFRKYTANFDKNDINILLKIVHTQRVKTITARIWIGLPEPVREIIDSEFFALLGLLHDIGRFEQIKKYGTLVDAESVDHAELGADILFKDGLIKKFVPDLGRFRQIAETAIRLHNKLRLPDNLDPETELYTKALRDADKVDIFQVLTEPPFEARYTDKALNGLLVRDEVMKCVMEHRCVPRAAAQPKLNDLEKLISQCCMAFELEFDMSRAIVAREGFLAKLLNKDFEELAVVKSEIAKAWGTPRIFDKGVDCFAEFKALGIVSWS